ncbi:MAG: hypothetical protein HQL37_06290, partial [Alphaproteobacteria bacterium]|nr:hypothetical protein [Alphaproteobacteria bacterium]
MSRRWLVIAGAVLFAMAGTPASAASPGSCGAVDFSTWVRDASGSLGEDGYRAVVASDRLPVYGQATGGAPLDLASPLRFGEWVRLRQLAGP